MAVISRAKLLDVFHTTLCDEW